MLEMAKEIWDFVHGIINMPPILILPVIMAVEGLAILTKIKNSKSSWRNFLLGLYCFLSGLAVSFLTLETETWREILNKGLVLGSVSALSYQIFKPVFKAAVLKIYAKLDEKLGLHIKQDSE
jgi:hypothetical protein